MTNQSNAVVVTGAGSGLGRNLSLGLAKRGFRVYGTAFTQAEVAELAAASDGAVTLSRVDITDDQAVLSWAEAVRADSSDGIGTLISNAGILTPGPLEVLPIDDIRREFEVNVFGALRLVNAFLPALRRTRGRIIQISTMSVDFPVPFNGPSSASKAAFETFATIYRAELARFGIEVIVAAPGSMRTGGPAKTAAALTKVAQQMTAEQRALYGDAFDAFAQRLNSVQDSGMDADDAAAQVIELVDAHPAPRRVAIGANAETLIDWVKHSSPEDQDARRLQLITPSQPKTR